jgi:hypothetical protein
MFLDEMLVVGLQFEYKRWGNEVTNQGTGTLLGGAKVVLVQVTACTERLQGQNWKEDWRGLERI